MVNAVSELGLLKTNKRKIYSFLDKKLNQRNTVFVRISVTFSTLHSFISVEKIFDEHVYLTQHAHEP
jgi:hypothetical protein